MFIFSLVLGFIIKLRFTKNTSVRDARITDFRLLEEASYFYVYIEYFISDFGFSHSVVRLFATIFFNRPTTLFIVKSLLP